MLKQIIRRILRPIHDYQVKVTENDQFKRIEVKGLFEESSFTHFKK